MYTVYLHMHCLYTIYYNIIPIHMYMNIWFFYITNKKNKNLLLKKKKQIKKLNKRIGRKRKEKKNSYKCTYV